MIKPNGHARVVICEDSQTYSHALTRFLERDDDLQVVGVCGTAEQLLRELPHLDADLVTMDLELPGMNGVEAIERIMRTHPQPILVVSAHTERGSERAAAALAAGALDAIHKRDIRLDEAASPTAVALRRRVKRLACTRLRTSRTAAATPRPREAGEATGRRVSAIGIVASTGGPAALAAVLSGIPADFPVPVLVVQHISTGFTEGLVRWLDGSIPLTVGLARDRAASGPGVWFAPDDAHITLEKTYRLRLDFETQVGRHRPSGDVLLRSLADVAGADAVAVVLTGMGRDGADGLAAVQAIGGLTIAQDATTAVINGMPSAAIEQGAQFVLAPLEIGRLLGSLKMRRKRS
jgi:two-component system chemotaxis response regulator CheB